MRPFALHHIRIGPEHAPAVLFLHGITESHRYFSTRVRPLASAFHLVLPDLPGFGFSPKPVVRYSVDLFVDAIREFVEVHGLDARPLHLVGHSLGAILALEYAGKHPEKIERIALLNLPRFSDPEAARQIFYSGSPSYRKLLDQQSVRATLSQLRKLGLAPALRNLYGIPWEVLADCRRFTFQSLTSTLENCLMNYSLEPALERMPARPTLLLHGERDQVAPFAPVADLPRSHPHMALRSFRSGGHHVLHTHPREAVWLIGSHLAGTNGS